MFNIDGFQTPMPESCDVRVYSLVAWIRLQGFLASAEIDSWWSRLECYFSDLTVQGDLSEKLKGNVPTLLTVYWTALAEH